MLAVKRLTDLCKSQSQAEVNTLRRKIPGTLEIVTIETLENGECHSPLTPKMTTFQDSELSHELQTAMSNSCQETLTIKSTQGMSRSQESIGARSRGSGHSQENMLSQSTSSSHSQESLGSGEGSSGSCGGHSFTQAHPAENSASTPVPRVDPAQTTMGNSFHCSMDQMESSSCVGSPLRERNLPEGMDHYHRPSVSPEPSSPLPVPSPCTLPHVASKGTAPYVFMYPHVSLKAQSAPPPSMPEQAKASTHLSVQRTALQSTAQKAFSYLHSHCGPTEPPQVPPKPKPEQQNGEGFKHKKRSQSLNRYALSDGEPDEEEPASSSVGSYATLTRRPGRSQVARTQPPSEAKVLRSQSFAIRARKKGPPPPPPKRLSSVSSPLAVDAEFEQGQQTQNGSSPSKDEGDNTNDRACLGKNTAAKLDRPIYDGSPAQPLQSSQIPSCGQEGTKKGCLHNSVQGGLGNTNTLNGRSQVLEGSAPRRRTFSESAVTMTEALQHNHEDIRSDTEEDGPVEKDDCAKSPCSSQNSSSECIPFAEEGNLTIKQRPKPLGQLKTDASAPDSDSTLAQSSGTESQGDSAKEAPVLEFNLTESDTVKRRPRCKEREPLQNVLKAFGMATPSPGMTTAPQYAQAQAVSISGPSLHMMEPLPTTGPLEDDHMAFQIVEIEKSILSLEKGISKLPVSLKPASPGPPHSERHGGSAQLRIPATVTGRCGF